MIHKIDLLCADADGRYANDAELVFFQDYLRTAKLRFSLYQKIQHLEPKLVQQTLQVLKQKDPTLLQMGDADLTAKWQRDTVRVLRYAATALLTDDPELFKEKILLWFQTIMKSFKADHSCEVTYQTLQAVFRDALSSEEMALFGPLLEMSRHTLGTSKL